MNNFDIGIIGAGVGGAFAALKISKDYKDSKTIVFDLGRPPMKRRRQLEGWLGCLPNSDGKLYLNDMLEISDLVGTKKSKSSYNNFNKILSNIGDFKVLKDKSPTSTMNKKLNKLGYEITLNDYIQILPKDVHALSKYMSTSIEDNKNIYFSFDNEVKKVYKNDNHFVIITEHDEYQCEKIIIAVGRSGWRWAKNLYSSLGIIEDDNVARFGIRIEINSSYMKDFNKSNCTLTKKEIEIGPLSWFGTIIPEDHVDLAISAFRSNENRWKTDKVSFSLISKRPFLGNGFDQTDRIGKLTFVLSNDRVIKEKVSAILSNKSKISIISEYNWLNNAIIELSQAIPEIINKSYFYVPTITPLPPKIKIKDNLESEIDGMFVIGESAGIRGILAAGCMGILCAESICK